MLRLQPPPPRTQRADFPHYALLWLLSDATSGHRRQEAEFTPVFRENSLGSKPPAAEVNGPSPLGASTGWRLAYGAIPQRSSGRIESGFKDWA